MLPAITIEDFKGSAKIGVDTYALPDFTAFVDEWYPKHVREILGQRAYSEIAATNPLPEKWADVFAGCEWQDGEILAWQDGLRAICIDRLYWGWQRDAANVSTSTGIVQNANENSVPATRGDVSAMANSRWNIAAQVLCDLMRFFRDNETIAQEVVSLSYPMLGVTRLAAVSTKYLAVGDELIVDNTAYIVAAIAQDAWIEVVYTIVSATKAVWYPFRKYNIPTKQQGRVFA